MPSKPQSDQEVSNELDLDALPRPEIAGHAWLQQGTLLMCKSCPFSHATTIPVGYQLYGVNEKGEPLLRPTQATYKLNPDS
jgi:hypothetical protein